MQQRQLRLGDILDDYCPRERRVTNHAVVAMVGDEVKQTRCTTCDAEHEYKHAKIPRQRRKKTEAPAALYAQVAAGAPKRVAAAGASGRSANDSVQQDTGEPIDETVPEEASNERAEVPADDQHVDVPEIHEDADTDEPARDEGPVHRPLIRASLPRPEGQQPPARPIPEFTIRQPGSGQPGRFRPRHHRGGQGHQFQGNRSNGNMGGGSSRGPRPGGGRPGMKRHGHKRSK
jgi:hypothetical protein